MTESQPYQLYNLIRDKTSYSVNRIGALYKDFDDDKQLNPEGFQANLISWANIFKVILDNDVIKSSKLSIPHKTPDLSQLLVLPTIGKPLSLNMIINELVMAKTIIPLSLYLSCESNINQYLHPPTGFTTYFSPFHWRNKAYSTFKGIGDSIINVFVTSSERYVVWSYLVEFSHDVLKHIKQEITDGMYSTKIFDDRMIKSLIHRKITANFSDLDLQILLTYLSRDVGECSVKTLEDVTVVKFDKQTISDEDVGIAQLRYSISQVAERMNRIEDHIGDIKKRITEYPAEKIKKDEGIKASVLNLLSQRRHYIETYRKCSSTYNQLLSLVSKIDEATSNVGIVTSLKQSSRVLEQLNSQVDVQEIDDINLDIEEQMETTNQISSALGLSVVDDEIEDEYNALLKQQEQDDKETKKLLDKLNELHVDNEIRKAEQSSDKKLVDDKPELIEA